jgi:hypothetical protein
MRGMAVLLLALALFGSPAAALGPEAASAGAEAAILQGIVFTQHSVARGSDERVYASGHHLQSLISGGVPVFTPKLHEVQRAKVDGQESTIQNMLSENDELLGKAEALTDLHGAQRLQQKMFADGRMGFDGTLHDTEMGVFRFNRGRGHEGTIGLNPLLAAIGKYIGHAFAATTLFHEAGHAADAAIDETGVIEGEIPAFQLQYAWIKFVDPTGEKLGLMRVALAEQHAAYPSALTKLALDYARTLDVLRGTGGDTEKIRAFIKQLGYEEGHGKDPVPPPQA